MTSNYTTTTTNNNARRTAMGSFKRGHGAVSVGFGGSGGSIDQGKRRWQPSSAPGYGGGKKGGGVKNNDGLTLESIDENFLGIKVIKDKNGGVDVVLTYDSAGAAAAAAAKLGADQKAAGAAVSAPTTNSSSGEEQFRTRLPILKVAQSSRTSLEADLGAIKLYNGKEAVIRRGGQNKATFVLNLYGADLSKPVLTEAQREQQTKCFPTAYRISRAIIGKVFDTFRIEALRSIGKDPAGWIGFCAKAIENALWPAANKLKITADALKKQALKSPESDAAKQLFEQARESFINGAKKMPGKPFVPKNAADDAAGGGGADELETAADGKAVDAELGGEAETAAGAANTIPLMLFVERGVWGEIDQKAATFRKSKAEGPPHDGPLGLPPSLENWPRIVDAMAKLGAKYNGINYTDARTGQKIGYPTAVVDGRTIENPTFDPLKVNKSGKKQEALVQLDALWRIYLGPSSYGIRIYIGGDVAIVGNQTATKAAILVDNATGYNSDDGGDGEDEESGEVPPPEKTDDGKEKDTSDLATGYKEDDDATTIPPTQPYDAGDASGGGADDDAF